MRISDWSSDVCSSDLAFRRLGLSLRVGGLDAGFHGSLMIEDRSAEIPRQWRPQLRHIAIAGRRAAQRIGGRARIGLRKLLLTLGPVEPRSEGRRVGEEGVSTC